MGATKSKQPVKVELKLGKTLHRKLDEAAKRAGVSQEELALSVLITRLAAQDPRP
jgi:hypothetical protein